MLQNQDYSLQVNQCGRDKWLYRIVNNRTGETVATRTSKRNYVAATIDGCYFFGRLDLVGKGDHGQQVKIAQEMIATTPEDYEILVQRHRAAARGNYFAAKRGYIEYWDTPLDEIPEQKLGKFYRKRIREGGYNTLHAYYRDLYSEDRWEAECRAEAGDVASWVEKRQERGSKRLQELQVALLPK